MYPKTFNNVPKAKSETYLRNMYALPENLPQIDFSVYRKRLANTALVDEFEQKYKALKVSGV